VLEQGVRGELLEREAELALADELIAHARRGVGELLVIEGPAGAGKTRLLEEIRQRAAADDLRVLWARGAELEQRFPFAVARQLFEPVLAVAPPAEREAMLEGVADAAAAVVAGEPRSTTDLPHHEGQFVTLHGLFWLTSNVARSKPLLIAVDDAHWADPASLRYLAYLAHRLHTLPTLVMLATRPPHDGGEVDILPGITTDPAAHTVSPAPFSESAVHLLVTEAFEAEPAQAFCAACRAATGGNPFLLRELLAELSRAGVRPVAAQADQFPFLGRWSVPRSVLGRLRRMPAAATTLAQSVAVLGGETDLRTAAQLVKLDYAEAGQAAQQLADAEILHRSPRLAFAHSIVRAAVHANLDIARRDALHVGAARLLDERGAPPEDVAAHLLVTAPTRDQKVVELLRAAAAAATGRGALAEAVAYLRRALEESPSAEVAGEILEALGTTDVHLRGGAGFDALREAIDLVECPLARAERALKLGHLLSLVGQTGRATEVLAVSAAELEEADEPRSERFLLEQTAAAAGDLESAGDARERFTHAYETSTARPTAEALAFMSIMVAARAEPRDTAMALAQRALMAARDEAGETWTAAFAASALTWVGRPDLSRPVWDRALSEARERGSELLTAIAMSARSNIAYRVGLVGDARRMAAAAAESMGANSWGRDVLSYPIPCLVDALVEQGDLDAAEAALVDCRLGAGVPETWASNFVLDSRGRLRLAQSAPEDALADFVECGRRLEAWDATNPGIVPWRSHAAAALLALGRPDEAHDLAAAELDLARLVGAPRAVGIASRAAGLARGNDGEGLLAGAVAALEGSGADLDLARALTDLGGLLSRAGRRVEARKPLRRAVALATAGDATALAERAREELLTTGARPRRVSLSGPESLTARERRVADMAAEGLTNKRIAQELFVTEKTVELHLRNAYHKLEIEARSQLSGVLGASSPS
jgi:ATP/maltotriose-dependent transcriptional regulator MalT